jgi:uncharacterized protein
MSTERGNAPAPARVVETHISVLVFFGDRVYKLRKPVRLDVLDFTDRAAREEDCRREVELNRRLAPDVYLGVADVVLDGEPIDHLVVMRALPEERRLATLVGKGADVERPLREVGAAVATFHATAARSPAIAEAGRPAVLGARWEADFAGVAPFLGSVLDPVMDREIRILVRQWLRAHRAVLDARVAAGAICDGHGDLQAEDVFCLDDGVRILDCIEFSDELRHGDVCADVAFLAMDLERLGRPDAAARFVHHYESAAGAPLPEDLLHHYVAQRAYVRAKVACLRLDQGADDAAPLAQALHALAAAHLRRAGPLLVLVGGLPGSGKSTLAAGLAAQTGWALVRSDEVRDELQPRAGRSDPAKGRYAPEAVHAVYAELLERARRHLAEGEPVIVDASWVDAGHRAAARQSAEDGGAELVALCCGCDEQAALRRIRARRTAGGDPSEATAEVRAFLAARADPWPDAVEVDTSADDPAVALAVALAVLGA